MSDKYTVHTIQDDEGDFFFCVFERTSENVIDFFYFQEDAAECAEFMINGGAFDGFTPKFMLKNVPTKSKEINRKFDALIAE